MGTRTTAPGTAAGGLPSQGRARLAGALYLLTFLTSVPTLVLYRPLRDDDEFVLGAGDASSVQVGLLLEVALAVACVATAVVLFPVVRRQSTSAALGFLAARVVEAALIVVGVVSLLAVLVLRRDAAGAAGADAPSLRVTGQALLAVYDGTFLLGQSLMPVFCALCLGSALYRSRLVPRALPVTGLVGAPLLLGSDVAVVLGLHGQGTASAALAALPIAAWELSLGVWLLVRGFRLPAAATGAAAAPSPRGEAPAQRPLDPVG